MKFTAIVIAATALFASAAIAAPLEEATCGSANCHEGFRWVCRHQMHNPGKIDISSLLTSHNSVILATAALCATIRADKRQSFIGSLRGSR